MGHLNSDSSVCKWHLNAGKELTNKETAARLLLTNPLNPSVHAVGLSRFYLLPNDQKCHDEHKYVIGGLTEGRNGLCTSYQSPGAGSPAGGEQYLPPGPPTSLTGLFLWPGQAVVSQKTTSVHSGS